VLLSVRREESLSVRLVRGVLAEVGLNVAVIPHYDNQEGGNHDTRFCYLGERRLALLEPELPDGAFVLGIDEHTGMIMDLDADTVEIVGKGAVTLRRDGVSVRLDSGHVHPLDTLRAGRGSNLGPTHPTGADAPGSDHLTGAGLTPGPSPSGTTKGAIPPSPALPDSLAAVTKLDEAAFDEALTARDADAAVAAVLQLESAIVEWSRDTLQSDEIDRARAALRSMIVRLGTAATQGLRDIREVVGPVVEAALAARVVARAEKSFVVSDAIRDELVKAGIEVRDTPDGADWLVLTR